MLCLFEVPEKIDTDHDNKKDSIDEYGNSSECKDI